MKKADLEKNNNWYLIEQQSKVEDRILKRICFVNAERDTCEEIVLKVHDGYSLSITPDFEVDEDGRVHQWLETVGEKVEECLTFPNKPSYEQLEKELAELKEKNRWRRVEDELPEDETPVFISHNNCTPAVGVYDGIMDGWMAVYYPTHWRPLPELPAIEEAQP